MESAISTIGKTIGTKRGGGVVERLAKKHRSGFVKVEAQRGSRPTNSPTLSCVTVERTASAESAASGAEQACKKLWKLHCEDVRFTQVEKLFLEGLGAFSTGAQVTGVYELRLDGPQQQARVQLFRKAMETLERLRGSANLTAAWYGCSSKDQLLCTLEHGFTRTKPGTTGIHLVPKQFSRLSAVGADVDENGEQHILFCRVLLGRSEQLVAEQRCPSSEAFDTAVDSFSGPKRFVIWSDKMSSYILPTFAMSFKLPREWHEVMDAVVRQRASPSSEAFPGNCKGCSLKQSTNSQLQHPKLFTLLKPKLPEAHMQVLLQQYLQFKAGGISRECLLATIRAVVGDHKLQEIQEQVLRNSVLAGLYLCDRARSKQSTTDANA